MEKLTEAILFATTAHSGQFRKNVPGLPYISHPIAVMKIVAENCPLKLRVLETAMIAAVLHDTVEDTDVSLDEIETYFGKEVSGIVDLLTNREDETIEEHLQRYKSDAKAASIAVMVKMCDILHNLSDCGRPSYAIKKLYQADKLAKLYAPDQHWRESDTIDMLNQKIKNRVKEII